MLAAYSYLFIPIFVFSHTENVSEAEIYGGDYRDIEKTVLCDGTELP